MALAKEALFVEFSGKQVSEKELINGAKQVWKDNGNKVKDLVSTNLYYKPEESKCYFVMNEGLENELTGSFDA